MTRSGAEARATIIWHNKPHRVWSPDIDDKWFVVLQDHPNEPHHHLDEEGHADCHPECAKLEMQAIVNAMGRASRGKIVYKSVYIDEPFAAAFHDAICGLMNAHPDWTGSDIDVDWEEYEGEEDE